MLEDGRSRVAEEVVEVMEDDGDAAEVEEREAYGRKEAAAGRAESIAVGYNTLIDQHSPM